VVDLRILRYEESATSICIKIVGASVVSSTDMNNFSVGFSHFIRTASRCAARVNTTASMPGHFVGALNS
jgi:hypothetical protein